MEYTLFIQNQDEFICGRYGFSADISAASESDAIREAEDIISDPNVGEVYMAYLIPKTGDWQYDRLLHSSEAVWTAGKRLELVEKGLVEARRGSRTKKQAGSLQDAVFDALSWLFDNDGVDFDIDYDGDIFMLAEDVLDVGDIVLSSDDLENEEEFGIVIDCIMSFLEHRSASRRQRSARAKRNIPRYTERSAMNKKAHNRMGLGEFVTSYELNADTDIFEVWLTTFDYEKNAGVDILLFSGDLSYCWGLPDELIDFGDAPVLRLIARDDGKFLIIVEDDGSRGKCWWWDYWPDNYLPIIHY